MASAKAAAAAVATAAAAAAAAATAAAAAATAAAAVAAAEDLRFGGCGEKFDRLRPFLAVFGRFKFNFGPFKAFLDAFRRF